MGVAEAGEPGTEKSGSEQGHQEEPVLMVGCLVPSHTWHLPTQLLFSAVFSENEGLSVVNMLLGWKDAHAHNKL